MAVPSVYIDCFPQNARITPKTSLQHYFQPSITTTPINDVANGNSYGKYQYVSKVLP